MISSGSVAITSMNNSLASGKRCPFTGFRRENPVRPAVSRIMSPISFR